MEEEDRGHKCDEGQTKVGKGEEAKGRAKAREEASGDRAGRGRASEGADGKGAERGRVEG